MIKRERIENQTCTISLYIIRDKLACHWHNPCCVLPRLAWRVRIRGRRAPWYPAELRFRRWRHRLAKPVSFGFQRVGQQPSYQAAVLLNCGQCLILGQFKRSSRVSKTTFQGARVNLIKKFHLGSFCSEHAPCIAVLLLGTRYFFTPLRALAPVSEHFQEH